MTEAVIIDAVRTPAGKRNGSLKDWHPADLLAHVLKALEERNNLDPALVDDVITGCGMQKRRSPAEPVISAKPRPAGWPSSGAVNEVRYGGRDLLPVFQPSHRFLNRFHRRTAEWSCS